MRIRRAASGFPSFRMRSASRASRLRSPFAASTIWSASARPASDSSLRIRTRRSTTSRSDRSAAFGSPITFDFASSSRVPFTTSSSARAPRNFFRPRSPLATSRRYRSRSSWMRPATISRSRGSMAGGGGVASRRSSSRAASFPSWPADARSDRAKATWAARRSFRTTQARPSSRRAAASSPVARAGAGAAPASAAAAAAARRAPRDIVALDRNRAPAGSSPGGGACAPRC